MEKYEILQKLGEGTYGKVYKAVDKTTGQLVAIKKARLDMNEDGIPPTLLRETSLLQLLSSSIYIVRLLQIHFIDSDHDTHGHSSSSSSSCRLTTCNKSNIYLVFEYLDTDLHNFISTNPRVLHHSVIQSFLYQICKGVAHCHSHGVLHRDLKPQNLLLDKNKGILKIGDLGLGRSCTIPIRPYTQEVVTLWYRAPELLLGSTLYSNAVDMWSVGCIFAEMVIMRPLFRGDCEFRQLLCIFGVLGTPTEKEWPGVASLPGWRASYPHWNPQSLAPAFLSLNPHGFDLLSKMLKYNPVERISAKAAMEHPFFDTLDKSQF